MLDLVCHLVRLAYLADGAWIGRVVVKSRMVLAAVLFASLGIADNVASKKTSLPSGKPINAVLKDGRSCSINNLDRPAIITSKLPGLEGALCFYNGVCLKPGAAKELPVGASTRATSNGCKSFEEAYDEPAGASGYKVFKCHEVTDPLLKVPGNKRSDYSGNEYRTKDNRICKYLSDGPFLLAPLGSTANARKKGFSLAQAECTDAHGTKTVEYPRSEFLTDVAAAGACRTLDEALEPEHQVGLELNFEDRSNKVPPAVLVDDDDSKPKKTRLQLMLPMLLLGRREKLRLRTRRNLTLLRKGLEHRTVTKRNRAKR